MSISDFLPLIQSLDALFPVGGFTLSNGLETYVQMNIVRDKETLENFLRTYLYTASRNELALCYKAAAGHDVTELDIIASASRHPREVRLGSIKMGSRYLKAAEVMGNYPLLADYSERISDSKSCGHYPIAVGLLIRDLRVDISAAVGLYAYSMLSTMANHAAKLVPLRQLDAQSALANSARSIESAVKTAAETDIDDIGAAGFGFDLRSMQHEKLYSRLYIS